MAEFAKYNERVAHDIAARIFAKYGPSIVYVAHQIHVPAEWLAGLQGMELPGCFEYPDSRSYRFEAGVYDRFKRVMSFKPWNWATWSYNGITYRMLAQVKAESGQNFDAVLRNLSTSYGQTQIMAYYILSVLKGATVAGLRDPKLHYEYTGVMLKQADPRITKWVAYWRAAPASLGRYQRAFAQICHLWNSGREWNEKPGWAKGGKGNIKTWSPYYMHNCALVAQEFAKLLKTPAGREMTNQATKPGVTVTAQQGMVVNAVPGPIPAEHFKALKDAPTPGTDEQGRPPMSEAQKSETPFGTLFKLTPPVTDVEATSTTFYGDHIDSIKYAQAALEGQEETTVENETQANQPAQAQDFIADDGTVWSAKPQQPSHEGVALEPLTNPPDLQKVGAKPGWKTSQGQLTGLFALVALAISAGLGYKISAGQVENIYEAGVTVAGLVGTLLALYKQLATYTNSRGKIQSNELWATASMNNPFVKNDNLCAPLAETAKMGLMGDPLGGIFGGGGVKDPGTWANVARTAGGIAGGKAGRTIESILGGSRATNDGMKEEEVLNGFQLVAQRHNEILRQLGNTNLTVEKLARTVEKLAAAHKSGVMIGDEEGR